MMRRDDEIMSHNPLIVKSCGQIVIAIAVTACCREPSLVASSLTRPRHVVVLLLSHCVVAIAVVVALLCPDRVLVVVSCQPS